MQAASSLKEHLKPEAIKRESVPILTLTLIVLNVIIYLVDRRFSLFGPSAVFSDLAMRPPEVLSALKGGPDRFPIVTLFTSTYLHGGFLHIFTNMLFLWVFGPTIEEAVGPWRFILYYAGWGVFAGLCQIYASPMRNVPMLGASGAIGGVLGSYFLLLPTNRLTIIILGIFEYEIRAWILLGVWFLYQIFVPQEGVASWAHAGGFLAGMFTVLVIGGRDSVLRSHPELIDDDE